LQDLKAALSILQHGSYSLSKVEFTESESEAVGRDELFSSVGGNVEAKRAIEEALALDPERRRILRKFGMSPPTGLLLYGPPGTGKTLLAKAVAKLLKNQSGNVSSVGGSFITLQASEIVRGEVGNSEKMIVSAFETARSNAPSVIFIDEFQALFTERSGSGSGKLSSTLLQCMDDVCRWRDTDDAANVAPFPHDASSRVVVMGATNTPWMVDKAFLRPGRFDRVVHVGLPALEERVSILQVHVARMRLASSENAHVDRICQTLAEKCDGFSGADLAALCRAAAVRCLAELGVNGRLEDRHFFEARDGFEPSCSTKLATRLTMWRP
jgi:SpoVK/Ycf46/Vps4 family AAA+-type ATPase